MKIDTGHLSIILFLILFSAESCLAAEQVTICGTGDSQLLLRVLADKFETGHPDITITVPDSIGSGGGVRAVARGKCDLARVARPMLEREQRYNLTYWLFARSPVAFVLHPTMERPQSLTSGQIVDIFGGTINRWEQVSGDEGKIYVVNREEQDSSRSILEKHLAGFASIETFAGRVFYSTHEAAEGLKSHRQTIGYLPVSTATAAKLKLLKVDGVAPTPGNVRSGAYKLVTPLGLAWKGEIEGATKLFIDFLRSPAAQEAMIELGSIAVTNG